MLLEGEIDLVLALGIASAVGLALSALGFFLASRAWKAHRIAKAEVDAASRASSHNEKRLTEVLNGIPVALVETDTSGRFIFANRAAHQLLGRKDSELIGLRFHSATWGITYPDGRVIPPDLLPSARALRGQTVRGFQHIIANPASRKRMLVSVTASPIMNPAGEVVGSTAALVEIEGLSRPEGEDDVRPEAGFDRQYFDVASPPVVVLSPEGAILEANRAAAELLARPGESLAGRDWFETCAAEGEREAGRADLAALVEGEADTAQSTRMVRGRNGDEPRLLSDAAVRDQARNVVAVVRTLAEPSRVADRAESDPAFGHEQAAHASGEIGVWWLDGRTGAPEYSAAMLRMWGLPEDRQPTAEEQRRIVHPDDRARAEAAFQSAWAGSAARYACEYRIVRPDGSVRWIASRGEVVRDAKGAPLGMRGVGFDITETVAERETLKTELAVTSRALESAEASKKRVEEALARAQKLETVGRLTSGVAHDFNVLLGTVTGALEMIRRQTTSPDRVERLAEAALTAAQRGERLTRQLSAFARRPEFEPEAVEAVTAVRDLEPTFRRLAGGSAPISVVTPPSAGEIRIDRAMFETAMLNMLLNALDAVRGGGDVTVRVDLARIDGGAGEALRPGDYVRISVVDTGAGMSADVAARAFEPFFTTKEAGEGAGLGLAQVAAFARQSGGAADIKSAPGEGAAVSLLLPVRAAGLASPHPAAGLQAGG